MSGALVGGLGRKVLFASVACGKAQVDKVGINLCKTPPERTKPCSFPKKCPTVAPHDPRQYSKGMEVKVRNRWKRDGRGKEGRDLPVFEKVVAPLQTVAQPTVSKH